MRRPGPRGAALALLLILALLPAAATAAGERWARVTYVNDGDTLTVRLDGRRELVRFLGIDAPETVHSQKLARAADLAGRSPAEEAVLGELARARLAELAPPGVRLRLAGDARAPRRDAHGRLLAYLYMPDGRMLNAIMVREGLARVFRRCGCQALEEFRDLERWARARGLGIWAAPRP